MKNSKNNGVWIGADQLTNEKAFKENAKSEFVELPVVDQLSDEKVVHSNTNRRDFLKYLGFGLGAATVAACDIPVRRAIPYVVKPDDIVPGVATYYASSFVDGGDYCSVLVKTREGRPIKIEGNTLILTMHGDLIGENSGPEIIEIVNNALSDKMINCIIDIGDVISPGSYNK